MKTEHNLHLDDCVTLREVEAYVDEGEFSGQDIITLWKENKLLTEKLANAEVVKFESFREEDRLIQENKELKRKKFWSFAEEEFWIYNEHEDNHLESLFCPVVVRAEYLKGLLEVLWSHNMYLGFVLEQGEVLLDDDQAEDAKIYVEAAKVLLSSFERENDGR